MTQRPDQQWLGEDLIILNLFHLLGMPRPSYLDIGAHHPFNISNTALLHLRGSRGINVEANPNLIEAFHRHRPEDINLNVGVAGKRGTLDFYFIDEWSGRNTFRRDVAEAFVRADDRFRIRKVQPIQVETLDDIVAKHAGGRFPDLLTIDVEGLDFEILRSCSFERSRPTAICVEAAAGSDERHSLLGLLRERAYRLYTQTVANFIFVDAAALERHGLSGLQAS